MNKIGKINFKEIKRISPSQFYSMKSCAYKSLLSEAFEKKPLLPVSPNAYLGAALHKILELISKGEIQNEDDFKVRLDEEIQLIEDNLKKEGYNYFVPLQKNARDFGLKVVLLKKHLKVNIGSSKNFGAVRFRSEQWFESKDQLVGGKVDLVIEKGEETEIIDFKTGAITQDKLDDSGETFSEIKKEYQEQLKLYAYLFFDNTGKFPARLCLVDLAKQKFTVEFTQNECEKVFEQAKELLKETNKSIKTANFNATPNEENCKYCLYRPACSYYLNYLTTNNPINDVCGIIRSVTRYQNGNVTVMIEQGNNKISVMGFESTHFEYFKKNIEKQINIFNLKKEAAEFVYSASRTTKIYEQ
jgi:CRISPR/Cas system-associated exonuclease Cas4 (RecB family)